MKCWSARTSASPKPSTKNWSRPRFPRRTSSVADLEGAYTVADLVNRQTGEVLLEANKPLTAEIWTALAEAGITSVDVFFPDRDDVGVVLSRTLDKDAISSPREALIEIYRKLRPGDPPTLETATALVQRHVLRPAQVRFQQRGPLEIQHQVRPGNAAEHAHAGLLPTLSPPFAIC